MSTSRTGEVSSRDVERRRGAGLCNHGDTLVAQGKLDAARKAYGQSLAIAERLAKANATNSGWQRHLSVSYMKFGELMRRAGKPAKALEQFQKARALTDRLVTWDPSNATWKNDLEFVRMQIAELRAVAPGR